MEKLSYIQYVFILLIIFTEAFFSLRNNLHEYKIKDTLANICIAGVNWIISFFLKGFIFLALIEIQKYSLFNFRNSIIAWIGLFFLSDLFHYGFHYLEHKSRFFWATHSVHHSSSTFNFSTAIRTAHTNTVYKLVYQIPLCLIGFDAYMVILIHSTMLLYGFFQHTEFIKKMGWFEYFLNTPSHHRVHHACDEKYLDKNFGLVLIIWDKLFGTFQPEEEKPTYGLTKPIKTYNPFKIVFHEWIAITKDVVKAKSWKEGLAYAFNKPGWNPVTENKSTITVRVKTKKTVCKKCAQCSQKCIARLENIRNKMNSITQPPPQIDQLFIPAPAVSSLHTKPSP
jgi:sterol desaturase/sphingolipid hydroxylase (fatty acid hydroxylase superfamily)